MKKILTSTLLLAATLLLTGCNQASTETTTSSKLKTQEITSSSINTRSITNVYYDVLAQGNYPSDFSEYDDANITLKAYHSDIEEDVKDFSKKFKALTGKVIKKLDGNFIVAKAGIKNNSSYEIQVRMVEDRVSYTKVYLSVVHSTTQCLTSPAISSPYTIINIPNDHKEVKFEVSHLEIKCN
ncbi:MAG TPA: hypothetical protein EYG69_00885 [Campylobacterales bacterium]|nr:hypothetical protein [Campylobacterales bacterium]